MSEPQSTAIIMNKGQNGRMGKNTGNKKNYFEEEKCKKK